MKKQIEDINAIIAEINKAEHNLLDRRQKQIGKHMDAYFKLKRQLVKLYAHNSADEGGAS